MATAYLVKWSVSTNMSLVLLWSGSKERKSMQTNSRDLLLLVLTKAAALSGEVFWCTHHSNHLDFLIYISGHPGSIEL